MWRQFNVALIALIALVVSVGLVVLLEAVRDAGEAFNGFSIDRSVLVEGVNIIRT